MTPDDFEYVCRLVRGRSGIVLEAGKEYLVDARLTPLSRECGLGSISELVTKLRAGSEELAVRVVAAMVTSETSFFRDVQPFETLRTTVLPELIRRRRDERRLSIWCAACATGQEPYSIAMLLREHFPELIGWRVDLLATDLSAEVLDRARAGRYSHLEVNRGLPAALLVKYFRQQGLTWALRDDIVRMVEFRELNLTRPWPLLPRADVLFLRNVMIYFDAPTKKAILERAAQVVRPDGYLILGSAETTLGLAEAFARVELKGGFHRLVG
jgi:chemotaxis protein methyltransferase CheR